MTSLSGPGIRGLAAKGLTWATALLVWGVMLVGGASAEVQAPDGCDPVPEAKPFSVSQPLNIDLIKRQLLLYRPLRVASG